MNSMVEIKELKVNLMTPQGIVKAVRGANMSVRSGEVQGIVGESGCGKSVMVKALMRLHNEERTEYEGSIVIDGKNVLEMNKKELRKYRGSSISMIFQNPATSLDPIMKIGDQVLEVLRKKKVDKKEAKKKVLEMFEQVGIYPAEKRYNQYPFELSGGLIQRVMIVMAMISESKVLIADEPTTALDVTIQAQILELMKKVQKETGITIIFITHDLGVVAEICDRVDVMYAGQVVETGLVKDIFDNPGHPYTKALLESMPKGSDENTRMETILGTPPSLYEEFSGCAFAPRCKYCTEICKLTKPQNVELGTEHFASCHYAGNIFEKEDVMNG